MDTSYFLSVDTLHRSQRLFAILGLGFFLLQFVLSSRIKWIERGFGLDKMLSLHRWFGRVAVGFLLLHFSLLVTLDLVSRVYWLWDGHRLLGLAALVIVLLAASVASLYKTLHLRYELWKGMHMANYVAFPLALLHLFLQPVDRVMYGVWIVLAAVYVLLILHRTHGIYVMRKSPFTVVDVIKENRDTWTLQFAGRPLKYLPGQFMHVQLRRRDRMSSSHPFSMTSGPTDDAVAITVKESGDFTSTIGETQGGDLAYIDAPYGRFSFLHTPGNRPLAFIAGGIGIAPFMSMLRYMRDAKIDRDVHLFWGNRTEENLLFRGELEALEEQLPGLKVILVMSDQPDWPEDQGRIDANLLRRHIGALSDHEFFLCGPPPMTRAITRQLKENQVPSDRIHRELFEL